MQQLPSNYTDAVGVLLRDVQEGVTRLDTVIDLAETAREKAIRERQESHAMLSGMSHELRTPLNAIIGFSEIMQNEMLRPVGQPTYKEYAADMVASGSGLLTMIEKILDLS